VRGVILAGGGATRFEGRPKGLELVGGRRILDRVADVLFEALGTPPLIVANAPEAASWRPDLEVAADDRTGFGALGGLYTAVVKGPAPVVVVAWDMPFLAAPLIREVAAATGELLKYPAPGGPGRRAGVRRLWRCLPRRDRAMPRRGRPPTNRLPSVHQGQSPPHRVGVGLVDPALAFFNVNTANDLAEAEASWQARASSRS
jgi:molybdopterin-guanine dinucleotide biosynthesis protein A